MDGFFTMHGKYRNRVILFASCLTTGKNIGQYKQILQTLKRRIRQETGHGWRPTRVIFDYEQSLIAAVQTELPNSQVSGCYFHITKALWRHIQTLGMSVSQRQHARLRNCIRKVMAIGYLPLLLVRQNFNILRNWMHICFMYAHRTKGSQEICYTLQFISTPLYVQ